MATRRDRGDHAHRAPPRMIDSYVPVYSPRGSVPSSPQRENDSNESNNSQSPFDINNCLSIRGLCKYNSDFVKWNDHKRCQTLETYFAMAGAGRYSMVVM